MNNIIPAMVGLFYNGQELEAEWYTRKPWVLERKWVVRTAMPLAGGMWKIDSIRCFDKAGRITDEYKLDNVITLCGPSAPNAKHLQWLKDRGKEFDPHVGDNFTFYSEIIYEKNKFRDG